MTNLPKNQGDNIILEKSFAFSVKLIGFVNLLARDLATQIIVKQLIRSGTSVGANVEEAIGASSRKEFIHRMTISRREARESRYWLRLLKATSKRFDNQIINLGNDITELIKLLNSILKTSRDN